MRPRSFFVMGCQRSGTTMAMDVFGRCDQIAMFAEHDERANFSPFQVMEDLRFRPADQIEALIEGCGREVTVFKPLCDCQWGDQILDRHQGRAFWFFRNYRDVAASAARKWAEHHRDMMLSIVNDGWGLLNWRIERLSPESIELVRKLTTPDISNVDASALFWYLRNQVFFENGFDKDERFMLVRYEDLVAEPIAGFTRIFDAMRLPLDRQVIDTVVSTSIGKGSETAIDPAIAEICDLMLDRLVQTAAAQTA